MGLFETLLQLLFPRRCVVCDRRDAYCCPACLARLPRAALFHPQTLVLFDYHAPATRRLIWLLKYRGAREIAQLLARALYDELAEQLAEQGAYAPGEAEPWLVVPVPLSPRRLQTRGFNQAAEIAKFLVRQNSRDFVLADAALTKTRETASQVSQKSRAAREENLVGAFAADPRAAAGQKIILVDDVITTGATLRAAANALQAAGARTILPVAIAG